MIRTFKPALKALLLAAMISAPLVAVGKVNANTETVIGETAKKSNGVGLVLLMSLQRG